MNRGDCVEAFDQDLAELIDIEDVCEGTPERENGPLQLEPFVEEHLRDPLLHLGSNGIEEDKNDECGDDHVKEELLAGDEPHQPKDERQHEREGGQHAEASRQLVEVDQAVVGDRPRQRVEKDQDQDRAHRRDVRDPHTGGTR